MRADRDTKTWQFGCEHEFADIARDRPLPSGYGWDARDFTIVNSNGIANDPKGELYKFGGEINTPPTSTGEGQVDCLRRIKKLFPEAAVNYRSNLHIHIRVPGLGGDLEMLKQVQRYIHQHMRVVLPIIEFLPPPRVEDYPTKDELAGAVRRWRRRRVSHQTLLSFKRLQYQLEATTLDEFFNREPPQSKLGKPLWHAQPRLCVSLRQLLQTDTTEFRHFPGTLDEGELLTCIRWCQGFMEAALADSPLNELLDWARDQKFPQFPKYSHAHELRYRATVHDGTVSKEQIAQNIRAILAGEFDEYSCGVSRLDKPKSAQRGRAPKTPPRKGLLS